MKRKMREVLVGLSAGKVDGLDDGDSEVEFLVGFFVGEVEGGFVWPGTVGADVGFFVGFFVGLCVGVIEGLSVGFLVGLFVGEAEGLAVGVVSTCADSIVTSISNEEAAAALKSSPLTTSLTVSDTPVALEEISYMTFKVGIQVPEVRKAEFQRINRTGWRYVTSHTLTIQGISLFKTPLPVSTNCNDLV